MAQSKAKATTAKKQTILEEAHEATTGPRRAAYGSALSNHNRTAALWSNYLGIAITARQVCMMNILQKISRDCFAAKRDNLIDIAGYARNVEMLEEEIVEW